MLKRIAPRYRIPPTRLPFVNGEIAQVRIRDANYLVSAVWGGDAGGKLYFWNPQTHEHFMRELPRGVPGAYMLKMAVDGRLYIGDGHGDLHRYDPERDSIQTLVTGVMSAITWGGCVTDRYVIWSATGEAAVYDWRNERFVKKFSPVDGMIPHAQYGHNVLEAPDGKVLLFMDVPAARIVELDLATMAVRSVTPGGFEKATTTFAAGFVDSHTLVTQSLGVAVSAKVFSYPKYEMLADVPPPKDVRLAQFRGAFLNGFYYVVASEPLGTLLRFDVARRKWEILQHDWSAGDSAYLGVYQNRCVAGVALRGSALCYDPASRQTTRTDLDNLGVLDAHAMAVGAEGGLIIGAPFINCSFWTINMKTGRGVDRGRGMPGGGQINQIIWDAGRHRVVMSSYTTASITEYDPEFGGHWPTNPRLVASAESEHQMRPLDFKFDRYFFWMATSPVYGQLGGALSRINCDTGQIKIWRNIVPEQTVNGIVLDLKKHRVYFSTSIYADANSTPATQKTCEVAAFDMVTLKVIKRQALPDGTPKAEALCLLNDGRVLVAAETHCFAWDCDRGRLQPLGEIANLDGPIAQQADGTMWAVVGNEIGRLTVENNAIRFEPVIASPGKLLQIAEEVMYWTIGGDIYALPLSEI
jgi:hypothetical protein